MEARRRILEIGHGGRPLQYDNFAHFMANFQKNTAYDGVDLAIEQSSLERTLGLHTRNAKILYAEAECARLNIGHVRMHRKDARQLDLEPGYDELHAHRVFTDPSLGRSDSQLILAEARRLLKEEGALIAIHDVHMDIMSMLRRKDRRFEKFLSSCGFAVDESPDALAKATLFHGHIAEQAGTRNTLANALVIVARKSG